MNDRTRRFLDAAVERGWVTRERIDECLAIRETVREVGVDQAVEEILVKKGYLTAGQAQKIDRFLSARRVGKYQIIEKLGEGGAGIVYKAKQDPLERIVAIKILSAHRAGSKEYLERFLREARIAVTLNHENIVRGLDHGEASGYHYFAMEYVEGESLHDILEREGSLDEPRAFDFALQTVRALIHAAQFDLVHRDVKPENILVTPEGVAKLCDMGLAKPTLAESAEGAKDGTTIGTPTYMSPEQIRGKDETDFRADVYSLGITLYHLVAGRPPFRDENVDILIRKQLREAPTDPREYNLKLSSGAAAVILKMIAKDPGGRYPSLDALAEDLQAVLDGRPPRHTIQVGASRAPAKVRIDLEEGAPRRARLKARRKKNPILLAALGLAIVVVAAAVYISSRSPGETPVDTNRGEKPSSPNPPPDRPKPDEPARGEAAYRRAVAWVGDNLDAPYEAKRKRFEDVVREFPDTPWERTSRDEIKKLDDAHEREVGLFLAEAKEAFEALALAAEEHRSKDRHGEALAELAKYPGKYADTEWPDRIRELSGEIEAAAEKRAQEALDEADMKAGAGEHEQAIAALSALSAIGIPEIEERIVEKLAELKAARDAEAQARSRGEGHFRAVVGAAYSRAAGGGFREAEDDLVGAGDDEKLALFRRDLDLAWRHLREARRFRDALRDAVESLTGRLERFELRSRGEAEASGKILGATGGGIRISGASGDRVVRFADLLPLELHRLAFSVLDAEKGADRRSAALYFVVCGQMDAAEGEIRAAGLRGEDVAPLRSRKDLLSKYYRDRADEDLRQAERFFERGMRGEAMAALEKAVAWAPAYARPQWILGENLVRQGRNEEGLRALDRALALEADEAGIHYFRGLALQNLERRDPAIEAFRKFIGEADAGDGRVDEARQRIRDLEGNVREHELKQIESQARDAYRRRRWDVAIEKYEELLRRDPARKECLFYLGKAQVELGQVFEGYAALRKYLEEVPSGRRASSTKREIRSLERTLSGNDRSRKAFNAGLAEYVTENYEGAVTYFDTAVQEAPLAARGYYQRGMSRLRIGQLGGDAGNFKLALADFERARFLDSSDALALEGLALSLYYLTNYDGALKSALAAIKARPQGWEAYNVAGLVHLVHREYREALDLFTEGIKKAPAEVPLFINRARAYEGLERIDDARTDLETAKRKKPTWEQAQEIKEIENRLSSAGGGD